MTQSIGILTAGGDSPGLNAAIRGVGKAAMNEYQMRVIGFYEGFRGLMQNRIIVLDASALSGILTLGGTILGTSREKPHKMQVGGHAMDMTDAMVDTYNRHQLSALVCLGGGGTIKNAFRLSQAGLNVLTLPKTIDNDVFGTDVTFGFDTALTIATEAIDRLHSTAHSHHRIVVVEVMGHNAGWLALGAGLAGGADAILIPEIPYHADAVAEAILRRSRGGKSFSIVAVSEGAMSKKLRKQRDALVAELEGQKQAGDREKKKDAERALREFDAENSEATSRLAHQLEDLTGLESRVTILGHVQRGGTPSPADRLLATRLGTACARLIHEETYGVLVAARGEDSVPIPIEEVVGKRKTVPLDHPWIQTARSLHICLGDR